MLDLMRRKRRGLKFILWIVIFGLGIGMLLLFVDVGGRSGDTFVSTSQAVASVDGWEISVMQFRNTYYNFYDSYRRYYNLDGSNMGLLKMLRIDKMALDKLIKDSIVQREARRMGLEVSQPEVVDALRKIPSLNENGRFIGRARLEQLLRANNSSLPEFEASLVGELLSQKVRGLITDGIDISEEDVRKEFLESSQRVTIEYVTFKPEDNLNDVVVVESELQPFYEKNKEQYRIGEQRRIKYLQVNSSDLRSKVSVSEEEIRDAYNAEGDHDEVRARHILLKVEDPAKEVEVRTKAEAILAEARQGKDFAELAKKYSQDTANATSGGDLGFFKPEQMVKEFSDAALSLEPGKISDLVKTQYGFHIIKVEEKRVQTFEDKRTQLEFQLKGQKADELARVKADEAAATLKVSRDINKVATELGLQVRESGFFRMEGTIPGLGPVVGLQGEVFGMQKVGDVGTPHKSSLGFIVPELAEKKDSFLPDFKEVRSSVIEDYKKEKGAGLAESRARQFASSLREGGDWAAAAKKIKKQSVTPPPFTRRSSIDDTLRQAQDVVSQAFSMQVGKTSDSVNVDKLYVVFRLLSRDSFDEARFAIEKPGIQERLQTQKKSTLFQAYVDNLDQKLRKDQKILINQPLIDKIAGL